MSPATGVNLGSLGGRRANATTSAPRASNRRTTPRPKSPLAPVTKILTVY